MAAKVNTMFLVAIIAIYLPSLDGRLKDDVQTEIRLIKEDIKGIKDTEDMTKIAMKGFYSMVNGVDSRVTDLAKASSQTTTSLQKLSAKEELHHEEVLLHKDQIQKMSQKIESLTKREDDTDHKIKSLEASVAKLTGKLEDLNGKGMIDALHPVGSLYIAFAALTPPRNGQHGVLWEQLPEGYALMTASPKNVGVRNGDRRLDCGSTGDHKLTVAEMPSHSHTHERYDKLWKLAHWGADYTGPYGSTGGHKTSNTGGNKAHSHPLNILNQKILVWKRIA